VVRFFVNGVPTNVVVDDRVAISEKGVPLFIQPQDDNLWPLVLEKAWLKLTLGYESVEQHLPSCVLEELLGCRTEHHSFDTNSCKLVRESLDKGHMPFVAAKKNPGRQINP
jgi:hypothetical protein